MPMNSQWIACERGRKRILKISRDFSGLIPDDIKPLGVQLIGQRPNMGPPYIVKARPYDGNQYYGMFKRYYSLHGDEGNKIFDYRSTSGSSQKMTKERSRAHRRTMKMSSCLL
jgi:hypothetical protein